MAKNVIVPTPIFTEKEHVQFILPIYLYLQAKQGRDGTILTSLELLLHACGYVYNRQSKNSGFVDSVKDALLYLKQKGYIKSFFDKYGEQTIDDLNMDRPTNVFIIEVNEDAMNYTGDGFSQVFIDDYKKIIEFSMCNAKHRLSKMLYLYCFISRYTFHRHKNYIDDARYEDENRSMAEKTPNYYFTTYDRLSSMLGDGFSRSSIIKMLGDLDDCGAIHYKSIGNSIASDDGTVRGGGTVFVLDSKYWEIELEAAVQMEKNKKSQFYMKGAEATG